MVVKARAKVNLSLDVTARRSDGYHELDMLVQSVSLYDIIKVERGRGLQLRGDMARSRDNLCARAALAYCGAFDLPPDFTITLQKHIPLCAGLGGGSADAAAVLYCLERFCQKAGDKLPLLALQVGADVPFMLTGGFARAKGVGEALTHYLSPRMYFVGLMPETGASTKAVFSQFSLEKKGVSPDTDGLLAAVLAGDLPAAAQRMQNVLEPVTTALLPEILQLKKALLGQGALAAIMTGSGSLVYGLFENKTAAAKGACCLRKLKLGRVIEMQGEGSGLEVIKD